MACRRFGGEGACPEDADAPRSAEGAVLAAMLPVLLSQRTVAGLAGPEFDMAMALRLAEAEGVDPAIAGPLIAGIQSGVREAQRRHRESEKGGG